jgi:hypothetical protein
MKNIKAFSRFLSAALFCLASTTFVFAQTCSCSAQDGSCKVTIVCGGGGGCFASCGNGGSCAAQCFEDPYLTAPTAQLNERDRKAGNQTAAPNSESTLRALETLNEVVTLGVSDRSSLRAILSQLSGATKSDISYRSENPVGKLSFEVDRAPVQVWKIAEALSEKGTVIINGEDIAPLLKMRKAFLENQKVNVCLTDIPAERALEILGLYVGRKFRVEALSSSGSTETKLNLKLRNVNLDEILTEISQQSGLILSR